MALIVNWHLSLVLLVAIPLLIVMLFVIMKTAGVKKAKKSFRRAGSFFLSVG
jgi:ABC-type transport system involved in cytochrome bd biosynthesis fused ATPase/permease subunit